VYGRWGFAWPVGSMRPALEEPGHPRRRGRLRRGTVGHL